MKLLKSFTNQGDITATSGTLTIKNLTGVTPMSLSLIIFKRHFRRFKDGNRSPRIDCALEAAQPELEAVAVVEQHHVVAPDQKLRG